MGGTTLCSQKSGSFTPTCRRDTAGQSSAASKFITSEPERKRRDTIRQRFEKLSDIVPDCEG